jgi:hypothetical protein
MPLSGISQIIAIIKLMITDVIGETNASGMDAAY